MSEAAYLEPEQLAAQIVVVETRTMRALNAKGAPGEERTQLQVGVIVLMMDNHGAVSPRFTHSFSLHYP